MEEDRPEVDHVELALNLYRNTMTGDWGKVVEMYKQHPLSAIEARINRSEDTALHVAVSIAPEHIVKELIQLITNFWEGNTPLHVAASTGRLNICILLAAKYDSFSEVKDLVVKELFRNKAGESPLFLAAFHGNRQIFLYLHFLLLKASDKDLKSIDPAYRRNDGETALHCAIRWEYFDLAFEILQVEPSLAYAVNELGITPLHLLASKPSVFKSGSHLGWWKSIIYYCIYVEELEHETVRKELVDLVTKGSSVEDITHKFPENYQTCIAFYQVLLKMAQSGMEWVCNRSAFLFLVIERCKKMEEDRPEVDHVELALNLYRNTMTDDWGKVVEMYKQHTLSAIEARINTSEDTALHVAVSIAPEHIGIRRIKQKHVYSVQIMKILVKSTKGEEAKLDCNSGSNPGQTTDEKEETPKMEKTETPLLILLPDKRKRPEIVKIEIPVLVAAKDGITKMVDQILQNYPIDTNDISKEKTETVILLAARNGITEMVEYILKEFPVAINYMNKDKNIVLLAAENRQTHVLQHLLEQEFVKCKLIHEVDANENNALHLAAQIGKQKPWLIPGAALQMQWEIKWYEEGMTPEEIFNETHEELVKSGGEWLNKTSESCSVVAALIATVAFASSTTIPGSINETNGAPNLESHSMLTIFAVSSLVALCFSITALFSFLAILTSRYEQKDFRRDLPKKLLLGLTSLLVSITSMLISFCAGHYFMLKNKLKDKAFLVYAATCLPIVFFAIQQLPLYVDIVSAIFKKVPRSSYKAISL
ncbi:ankyrin repeat-containing protein itn1 [Quercus suber]|uniref:Ankyrin repeat-containing protein itn1 n=1 Tax=Quercus suber TaxID=58331 RepID=A0AAW0LBF2_QUESU